LITQVVSEVYHFVRIDFESAAYVDQKRWHLFCPWFIIVTCSCAFCCTSAWVLFGSLCPGRLLLSTTHALAAMIVCHLGYSTVLPWTCTM